MKENLMIYEVPDETAVGVISFPVDMKKEWEAYCNDLRKELFHREIVGFLSVDDKGKVKIEGDVTKIMQTLDRFGFLNEIKRGL
jgi:hypothetical protein